MQIFNNMKIILRWVLISIAVWVTTQIISGISVDPIWTALVVGACLTLFNMFVKPVVKILTLPINLITLGIFSLIINGVVFWYMGKFIEGFTVSTFYAGFIGSLVVSILNWILSKVFHFD